MTAQSSRDTLAFRMPEAYSPIRRRTLLERLADRWTALRERRAAVLALRGASDRDLRDMGITRSDIDRLFDPEFADEHAGRVARVKSRRSGGGW